MQSDVTDLNLNPNLNPNPNSEPNPNTNPNTNTNRNTNTKPNPNTNSNTTYKHFSSVTSLSEIMKDLVYMGDLSIFDAHEGSDVPKQ